MKDFNHIHNHTEYSLLDGAVRVDDLIKHTKENNMSAVAMTDHGVLYGIMQFYKKAKNAGIKPILGCEVYLAPEDRFTKKSQKRYHLILLAQNNKGFRNLMRIVSKSWLEGFYYKPRVDKDLLYNNREGLISLSACIQGEIPQLLLEDNREKAQKAVKEYQAIFGQDNFFIELQDHNIPKEKRANNKLIHLANEMDLPMVVTNDTHYLNKEDAEMHDILLALKTGTTINDENRMTFNGDEFYFKSASEMRELFPKINSAYENTVKITERCEVDFDFSQFHLPDYPGADDKKPAQILREKCEKGLKEKKLTNSEKARERLEYELRIISEMGYISYFLIVWDFIDYANKEGIRVGPGRGSAAGSLVSYLLGITKINPLKYGLIFERFLNPERVTMPDIDIDFDERRDEIIEYVKDRYGKERVAQIGTFGTMAARAAVRDVGRALDLSYGKVDRIAKMIPHQHGITLDKALEKSEKLKKEVEKDEDTANLIKFAKGLEGMPRHISTHAAGVIIGPEDLINLVPLQLQDESVITQLPMDELEDMGLLKMDFLGLRNLTVIENTLSLIEKRFNKKINIDDIPLDDQEVYNMLSKGETLGVFQMESYLFQDLNKRLQPENFSDIIALLALGRPGPLNSGLVDDFIKGRHGEKEVEYLHSKLEPILKDTFGLILYQEQVMEIASELAGYTMGEADLLRRGMGKKKKKLIAREREKFVKGSAQNGIDKKTANEIFDQVEYFAGYGFNKSHSAAYALLAYQTAYLKVKYPAEFMAALLSSVMGNLDKVAIYIDEAKNMGLNVLAPDVNESYNDFTTTSENSIRFGLKVIKNLGKKAIKSIIEDRKDDSYKSFHDFFKKVDLSNININMIEALIKAGAFDSFAVNRSQMLIKYEELYNRYSKMQKGRSNGQTSFFDLTEDDDFYNEEIEFPDVDHLSTTDKLSWEKEYLGVYLSGHPLDPYQEKIDLLTNFTSDDLEEGKDFRYFKANTAGLILEKKNHVTKRNNQMAFLTIEDWNGKINIVVFPDLYKSLDFNLEEGEIVFINGYFKDGDSLIANQIISLKRKFVVMNLRDAKLDKKALSKAKNIIGKNSGKSPVFFKINNKIILSDKSYWLNLENENVKNKLISIFRKENLKVL